MTLLAAIIVQFTSKNGLRKKHIDAKRETKKITIKFNFLSCDLESKLRFIEESHQYKDYKPFCTDMWDAIILEGRTPLIG